MPRMRGPAPWLSVVALLSACTALAWGREADRMVHVRPEMTDEILMNPGVGWQLLVHGAPRDEMERFPLVSTFYYRSGWTAYEPERGKYADSPAVRAIDAWLAEASRHGRYVAIRVVPYNSRNPGFQRRHSQKVQGCDSVIPPYVFEDGAKGFPEPGGSGGWVPVFWDPVYLRCHRELVEFLGERYAGHPNLAYVDVPAGNYGEMNLTNTEVPGLDDLSTWKEFGLTAESWSGMLREQVGPSVGVELDGRSACVEHTINAWLRCKNAEDGARNQVH